MNAIFGLTADKQSTEPQVYAGHSWQDPKYRQFLKQTDVPNPPMTWVTLDEQADSINDAFFVASEDRNGNTAWGDIPASYHNGACGFSFADGHAEIHKWRSSTSWYPVKFVFYTKNFDALGRQDFQWYWDRVGYTLFR